MHHGSHSLELMLHGYELTLRLDDAKQIEIENVHEEADVPNDIVRKKHKKRY